MNVLYINSKAVSNRDVKQSLSAMSEVLLSEYTFGSKEPETEVKELLKIMEEKKTELIISLNFLPLISIVCQAMKVTYAAWICSSYDANIYSYTVLNECNHLFFADHAQYQEFKENGFQRVHYLPLAANVGRIQEVLKKLDEKETETVDILMLQDIYTREALPYHPLSAQSPLKDAVKGYLEGCIACQHQRAGLPSMAEKLPPYVWEELTEKFPMAIGKDSVETPAHYFDHNYFNFLITYADRDVHLNAWAKNPYVKKACLYQACDSYRSEKVECHGRVSYENALPLVIRKGKINYMVAHRNWKSGIPQIGWDIMAAGGFLLSNYQEDYWRLFPDKKPILYTDEKDMLSKGIYYLHHEGERRELAEALAQEVAEKHTYQHRLAQLLQV